MLHIFLQGVNVWIDLAKVNLSSGLYFSLFLAFQLLFLFYNFSNLGLLLISFSFLMQMNVSAFVSAQEILQCQRPTFQEEPSTKSGPRNFEKKV